MSEQHCKRHLRSHDALRQRQRLMLAQFKKTTFKKREMPILHDTYTYGNDGPFVLDIQLQRWQPLWGTVTQDGVFRHKSPAQSLTLQLCAVAVS